MSTFTTCLQWSCLLPVILKYGLAYILKLHFFNVSKNVYFSLFLGFLWALNFEV